MGKSAALAWIAEHVSHPGYECLKWPMSRDDKGYGQLGFLGNMWKAHRLMCILANGEPPTKQHQAAHSCGRGHEGCVNPRHLRWVTNSENQLERYRRHGRHRTDRIRQKLTESQISVIQYERGKTPIRELAERFGVKRGTIDYWHKKARIEAAQPVKNSHD